MPGQLKRCVFDGQYTTTLWTIERDPTISDLRAHSVGLAMFFKRAHHGCKVTVAPEWGSKGYAHDHVLLKTSKPVRFTRRFLESVRAKYQYEKPNKHAISVSAWHARKGDDQMDYHNIRKYLTESAYKVKELSADIIEIDDVGPRMSNAHIAVCRSRPSCQGNMMEAGMAEYQKVADVIRRMEVPTPFLSQGKMIIDPRWHFMECFAEFIGEPARVFLVPP